MIEPKMMNLCVYRLPSGRYLPTVRGHNEHGHFDLICAPHESLYHIVSTMSDIRQQEFVPDAPFTDDELDRLLDDINFDYHDLLLVYSTAISYPLEIKD